jgi:type I restriction enzyme, R subunit
LKRRGRFVSNLSPRATENRYRVWITVEIVNPQRNLAVELLQKLLKGEIRLRARNLVQARSFSEMLENSLRRYQNRAIETAKVIEELIQLAKDMRQAAQRGVALGLNDDE